MSNLQDVLNKWHSDLEFRKILEENPELALEKAKLAVSEEDLIKIKAFLKIDQFSNEKLDERRNK